MTADTPAVADALPLVVHRWLREILHLHDPDAVAEAVPLPSRSDNRAFLVIAGGIRTRAYTLKLVPPGRAHALAHEAAITDYLHGRGFPVPRTLATVTLPEMAETITLRTHLPGEPAQAAYDVAEGDGRGTLAAILGRTLASVHTVPLDDVRDLWQFPQDAVTAPREWAENFVQKKIASDLDRVAPALPDAFPDDGGAAFADELTAWGAWLAGQPVPLAPLHGDWYFENVLLFNGAVSGLLDWEAARVGDPMWDVARTQVAAFADDAAGFAHFRAAYVRGVPLPADAARVLRYRLLMALGDLRYAVRHAPALIPARLPPVRALWQQCRVGE